MARPRGPEKIGIKIYLPVELAAKVELLLADPLTQKVTDRSQLVEGLLKRWLAEQGISS